MDLLPTDEQLEIAASVRSMLDRELALDPSRDGAATVVDRDQWTRCAGLGWFGLGLAEGLGGVGYGLPEETLLFEQIGRAHAAGPFLPTVLAARLAAEAGLSAASAILTGESVVGLAVSNDGHGWALWPHDADRMLVVDGDRVRLLTDLDRAGLRAEPSIDPQVPVTSGTVRGTLELETDAAALTTQAAVLVAATAAGIASATTEQSTSYAVDREQFGKPIGVFQAVKHRCADMAVAADAALQQTRLAAIAVQRGDADAAFQAHAARVVAVRAAIDNAQVNVQNHGGIGFTWEHTAHRFVVRARLLERWFGSTSEHLGSLLAAAASV